MKLLFRIIVVGVAAASGLLPTVAARAGGGCHELTQGSGQVVVIRGACFTPSIISIEPGQTVTFLNRDPFAHNVSGTGWGHYDDLQQGGRFTTRFQNEGLYPFACTIHPGMNGVVRVGDGSGPGSGAEVEPQSISAPASNGGDPPIPIAAAPPTPNEGMPVGVGVGLLVGGLVLGLALATLRRRASGSQVVHHTSPSSAP